MPGWGWIHVHGGRAHYGFSYFITFFPLPSLSGTLLFLRRGSLSSVIPALVKMHVPGSTRSVKVDGAMDHAGLLGWLSLIDQ